MRHTKLFSLFLALSLLAGSQPTISKTFSVTTGEQPIRLALADYIPPAMTTLAVQGNYAYVGAGPSLLVIDVSDPDHPQRVVYRLLPSTVKQIATTTGRVYVLTDEDPYAGGDNRIMIFDISRPQAPLWIGEYGPQTLYSLAAQDSKIYLSGSDGFSIVDVNNPRHPVTLSSVQNPNARSFPEIYISGNQAILAYSFGTIDYPGIPQLWVMDVSDPGQPVKVGELTGFDLLPETITDLSVAGNLLALAGFNSGGYDYPEFILIDLSDPAHPTRLSSKGLQNYGYYPSVAILNQRVYVSSQNSTIAVYDISDPSAPVLISQGEDPVWDLASASDLVYVAAGASGLAIYDSRGPGSLQKRGALLGIGAAEDVTVQDMTLYIADGGTDAYFYDYKYGGMAIADIQPPEQAEVVGKFMRGGHGAYIEVEENRAYLIAGNCFLRYTNCSQALYVLDVAQSQAPSLSGSYGFERFDPGQPYAGPVSIQNNIAYIPTNASVGSQKGLAVLDVSQPSTPTLLSLYKPPIPPHESWGSSSIAGAAITGTYGLLSIWTQADYVYTNSLQVFDVSNPLALTKLTSYPIFSPGRVFLQGPLGFVVDADQPWPKETLKIIDLSKLPQIQVLSSKPTPGFIYDVAYDGRYAYIANGEFGLRIIDLSDPLKPVEVYVYDSIDNAVSVAVDNDWVYLADQAGGVLIFRKVTPQFYLPYLSLAVAP